MFQNQPLKAMVLNQKQLLLSNPILIPQQTNTPISLDSLLSQTDFTTPTAIPNAIDTTSKTVSPNLNSKSATQPKRHLAIIAKQKIVIKQLVFALN